jgi:3-dehydroquinate synthase
MKSGDNIVFLNDLKEVNTFVNSQKYSRQIILIDENTRACCLPLLLNDAPVLSNAFIIEIPAGEENKTLDVCRLIWEELLKQNIDRNALLINLGGGVITDMGGFIASAYKRGISFINIPTTLLAMVDASAGGKTGIDFENHKNAIGFFSEADKVFIYPEFLRTLPDEELLSGYAEVVKHSLISDSSLWKDLLQQNPLELKEWLPVIQSSVAVKQKIVRQDYKEAGLRKVLNFGHTVGHALESNALKKKKPMLHGHAVALGMMAESYLSMTLCKLPAEDFAEINAYLLQLYGKYCSVKPSFKSLKKYLLNDKKNSNGNFQFSLIEQIGKPVFNISCSEQDVKNALRHLKDLL